MYSSSVEESARMKEDHMKDINSTVVRLPIFVLDSKIVAETDVVAESIEDMFPSFKCTVLYNGPWRDGDHGTHTQWQGMAFKKYIYEIKRARGESMTSWINRSDEALMDMRKKLATAPGANSSEPTMIPPQIQGWLLLHRAKLRDQDTVGVMTLTGGSLNIKLVEKSPATPSHKHGLWTPLGFQRAFQLNIARRRQGLGFQSLRGERRLGRGGRVGLGGVVWGVGCGVVWGVVVVDDALTV